MTQQSPAALIALGGNLGDVLGCFDRACLALKEYGHITAYSKVYQTPALTAEPSPEPVPDYWNAAITLQTKLSPSDLLSTLHSIEASCDRVREKHWGSRTLDLDLLDYTDAGNQHVISEAAALKLPHPEIANRLFVLQPLLDIKPDWQHPVTHINAKDLQQQLLERGESLAEGQPWQHLA